MIVPYPAKYVHTGVAMKDRSEVTPQDLEHFSIAVFAGVVDGMSGIAEELEED